MSDDRRNDEGVSRRDFGVLSLGAGAAFAASKAEAAAPQVVESDVTIKTQDGMCDAAYIRPATGAHAGVLIWPDAFGLRPSMRGFARRLAGEGYSVLVPNPFYRVAKAPVFDDPTKFDFANPADMAKLGPLTGSIGAAGAAERDTVAYVAFLDAQKEVDKAKKIGVQGYCMGGALVVRTAATSNRIGAGGSFHGGGLVTDKPESPHLLAPKINARMYFGIAANDDMRQPDQKDKLRAAFGNKAEVEVYGHNHGWCVPDMPMQGGKPIYDMADAERAWGKLLALYKAGLA